MIYVCKAFSSNLSVIYIGKCLLWLIRYSSSFENVYFSVRTLSLSFSEKFANVIISKLLKHCRHCLLDSYFSRFSLRKFNSFFMVTKKENMRELYSIVGNTDPKAQVLPWRHRATEKGFSYFFWICFPFKFMAKVLGYDLYFVCYTNLHRTF